MMSIENEQIKQERIQPTILELVHDTSLLENNIDKKESHEIIQKETIFGNDNKKEPVETEKYDSFQLLFEKIADPSLITDKKKIIIDANPSFCRLLNCEKNKILGIKLNQIMRKNTLFLDNVTKKIEIKEIQINDRYLYIFTDLDSKNEIERKEEISSIIDEIDDIVIIAKKNGEIIYFNQSAKNTILGIEKGRNLKEYLKIYKYNQKIKNCIEKNISETSEGIIEVNNIPFTVKIVPNKNKEIILIIKDQIERIKLKEQIKMAKEQYEQLVNNTTDIICIIDKKGNFKFVNKQFEKQLGYKIGSSPSLFQIIHPEEVPKFIQTMNECERTKKGFQEKEFRIINNKKKILYFSVSALPLIQNNVVNEFSMTFRDITAKKKKENESANEREKLKAEYKKLSEINKMKTEFVSMVSHDLKTPLTNIQGYASLLRNRILGPNTPKQQEAAEIIDKEAKNLAKLINDLLDLSKIDSGAMTLHKRPFKLKDLEEKCSLRNLAERKGLTLIWNTPDSLGEVYGDPERIAQVLINLVNNAIKFTDHGSVTINAFEKDKNYIQVDVIDTGPGIPKKEQELIFERFQRSSISKMYKKEGSGLGLAIAREIMRLHDSDITVKSEVGKGSTFSILLRKAPKNKDENNEIDKYLEHMGENNISGNSISGNSNNEKKMDDATEEKKMENNIENIPKNQSIDNLEMNK